MISMGEMPGIPGATIKQVPTLPSTLPGAVQVGPHSQARPGALLRIVPGTARFLATSGTVVEVAVEEQADPGEIQSFLFGGVRGALIHQRGELPLHAATLTPPGANYAVAIAGNSGTGKSTLAAELVLRGWSLLADDLTRITLSGSQPIAWPGGTAIKLTPDAVRRLGIEPNVLTPVCPGIDKSYLKANSADQPVPLRWVISLHRECVPEMALVNQHQALAVLIEHTFRRHYICALGMEQQHLAMVLRVAAESRCARLSGYKGVKAAADLLEQIVSDTKLTTDSGARRTARSG